MYIYTFIRIYSPTYIYTYKNTYKPYESLSLHAILVHVVTESGEEPYCLLKFRLWKRAVFCKKDVIF